MIGGDAFAYQDFLKIHKQQLIHAGIPDHYYRTVFEKLETETYDSGSYFILLTDGENWEVQSTKTVDATDSNTIFLIDHCWTFHAEHARKALKAIPGLAQRIAIIVGMGYPDLDDDEEEENEEEIAEAVDKLIDELSDKIWKLAETYTLQKDEDKITICYMMDEFGSRIKHSETPNVRFAPFFHIQKQFAITLMWPVVDEIPADTVITRDITFGETNRYKRAARLSLVPELFEINRADLMVDDVEKLNPYKMYGRKGQTIPDGVPQDNDHPVTTNLRTVSEAKPLKICTDMDFMADAITDPLFKVVNTDEDADIIFTSIHFDQFKLFYEDHPTKIVNQFPNENIICCKDLLLKVGRRSTLAKDDLPNYDQAIIKKLNSTFPGSIESLHPSWMPVGFDLVNELPVFVRHYLERQDEQKDNTWIIKPWNMSRGKFVYVTSNLSMIVKLAYTSPKIVQKYVHRPVLFYRGDIGRVKFDIRYIVLLKSVSPLKLFKYNVFWVRFANRPFELDEFDEYEKHFTVMNYNEGVELKQIDCEEFVETFEQQNPGFKWEDLDKKNCSMITDCLKSASALPPPRGLHHSVQSRAIYAVDFILKWNEDRTEMIPQMLEVNFNPDNRRACQYHPEFYNHCLKALLFEDTTGIPVTDIS